MSFHLTFSNSARNAGGGGGGPIPPLMGFVASGHFVSAKVPMMLIYPRPDSETGTFSTTTARHRLAYYDGTNNVQFECPIGIHGGARQFVYQIVAGPSWLNIGQVYGSSLYGVLYGTPTSAISKSSPATVIVRVWDQDLNHIDVTFTLATSSSTADFIFVDAIHGSDAGNGTYGSPFQTYAPVMGTALSSTTFPGARVYHFGGNTSSHAYQWTAQTSTGITGGRAVDKTKIPCCYLGLPGTGNVYIDASVAQLYDTGGGWDDGYFAGSAADRMTINGSSATAADTHTFELYSCNRFTWDNIDFTNPLNVANGSLTNSTSTFAFNNGSGSGVPGKNYWYMHNCTESGRSGSASNSMLLLSWFSVFGGLVEGCSAVGTCGFGVYFKDSNIDCEFTNGLVELQPDSSTDGDAMLIGGQQGESPPVTTQNCIVSYTFVRGGAIKLDFQSGTLAKNLYSVRNTVYRTDTNEIYAIGQNGGAGPYFSDSDVLIARGSNVVGSGITATNTEVQSAWISGGPPPSNCPINVSTGALVDSTTLWKTLYSKTAQSRGWEYG